MAFIFSVLNLIIMIKAEKLFANLLAEAIITNTRLANFLQDTIARLTAQNVGDIYKEIIEKLTTHSAALRKDISDVDTGKTSLKGKTQTNDEVVILFHQTMKIKEGVIADGVGGFDSEGYLDFYPNGLTEYSRATKTEMPTLVARIAKAADKHKAELSPILVALLISFEPNWNESRSTQQQEQGSLDDSRTVRAEDRHEAELAGTTAIHSIAALYPGQVKKCNSLFDFSLLFATHKHKKPQTIEGTLAPTLSAAVLNKTLNADTKILAINPTDNAPYFLYLAATANGASNGKGVEIKPGQSHHLSLAELGSSDQTFLIVRNQSDANATAYDIEVS